MANIHVMGAGWYGCHLALSLQAEHSVRIFDPKGAFAGASGANQNRLHLGFHYPRSAETRRQSVQGFTQFLTHYPDLSLPCNNWYAIHRQRSLIDLETYCAVMTSSGLTFRLGNPEIHLREMEGYLECDERIVCTQKACKFFEAQLDIQSGDGFQEKADYYIDCTGGLWFNVPNYIYEPCVMLHYSGPVNHPAITVMDGPFFTIYPTETPGLFTVYSVPHTPLCQTQAYRRAAVCLQQYNQAALLRQRHQIETQITQLYPDFLTHFQFANHVTTIRTKPTAQCALRGCAVVQQGNTLHVSPGKIDNIFHATALVNQSLQAAQLR